MEMNGSTAVRGVYALAVLGATLAWQATATAAEPAPATEHTHSANAAVYAQLPFTDHEEFDFAERGFIAAPDQLTIKAADGRVVWDMTAFGFINDPGSAPDTVNPSLWRNAQLNMRHGLFEVSKGIYQVRGYDLSNITFVAGTTGWIVFDPLVSAEPARAALALVTAELGERPVRAVIYSHTHVDHYGGVLGIVDPAEVRAGKVEVIAPAGFMEHAISENVTAGNAMSRRALFQFAPTLPRGPRGVVGAGLGQAYSSGTIGLIPPTRTIEATGEEFVIDGVRMVFQLTPGTEAPAEMNTWLPQFRALWMAENCTAVLHNVYTLRGARVRDARAWAHYIDEAMELYAADADVVFQSHHWPRWGNTTILDYLAKTRDTYRYIHDQTVRLMNHGFTPQEIAEQLELPAELNALWYNRGYYGTVRHNAKAVYQYYLGWYDANPANLDPLPPEGTAKKFVDYMGGPEAVLKRARADFEAGEYRWVAQVMKEVVFADPDNGAARELAAAAFEQLAYQAESGVWRNAYLQGAWELRNGPPPPQLVTSKSGVVAAMPPGMLFDYLAVRLNGPGASGRTLALNLRFTDSGQNFLLVVENGVLNHWPGKVRAGADSNLAISRPALNAVLLGQATLGQLVAGGDATITGRPAAVAEFFGLLDAFPPSFAVVTP